jgi:hypothetical protein
LTVDGNDSYTSNIKFDYGASAPTYFAKWGYKSSSDGNKVFLTITDGGAAKDVLVANYDGNVGIGQGSPVSFGANTAGLTINGSSGSHVTWQNNGTNVAFAYNVGNNFKIGSEQVGSTLGFNSSGATRMTIDAGGSVLIGKTTPADLHDSWNHIIIGEKGAIISTKGSVGIDGITLADNAYIDSDTGNYSYQTTGAASLINQTGGVTTFSNAASGSAGAALTLVPRMTLDASGNVGISNSIPSSFNGGANNLVVGSGSGSEGMTIYGGAESNIFFADGTAGTAAYIGRIEYSHSSDLMRFYVNNLNAMTIDANKDVGIGLSNGNHRLQVLNDKANFAVAVFTSTSAATTEYGISLALTNDPNDASRYFLEGAGGGTARFRIYSNGNMVNQNNSYGSISDEKLKENIVDAGSQWDDIKALRVRKYSFKKENASSATQIGVIAQEVEAAGMAGLVYESPDQVTAEDGTIEDTGEVTKTVKYSILYMKSVKALQEAMERIESLEARIAALES